MFLSSGKITAKSIFYYSQLCRYHSTFKPGGHSEAIFKYMAEKSCKFLTHILRPKIIDMSKGKITMKVDYKPGFQGGWDMGVPSINNGIINSSLDHVAGFCAWTSIENPKYFVSTADLEIQHLAPAPLDGLLIDASTVSINADKYTVDAVCWNHSKTLKVATGRAMFKIYKNPYPLAFKIFEFMYTKFGWKPSFMTSLASYRKPKPASHKHK